MNSLPLHWRKMGWEKEKENKINFNAQAFKNNGMKTLVHFDLYTFDLYLSGKNNSYSLYLSQINFFFLNEPLHKVCHWVKPPFIISC